MFLTRQDTEFVFSLILVDLFGNRACSASTSSYTVTLLLPNALEIVPPGLTSPQPFSAQSAFAAFYAASLIFRSGAHDGNYTFEFLASPSQNLPGSVIRTSAVVMACSDRCVHGSCVGGESAVACLDCTGGWVGPNCTVCPEGVSVVCARACVRHGMSLLASLKPSPIASHHPIERAHPNSAWIDDPVIPHPSPPPFFVAPGWNDQCDNCNATRYGQHCSEDTLCEHGTPFPGSINGSQLCAGACDAHWGGEVCGECAGGWLGGSCAVPLAGVVVGGVIAALAIAAAVVVCVRVASQRRDRDREEEMLALLSSKVGSNEDTNGGGEGG